MTKTHRPLAEKPHCTQEGSQNSRRGAQKPRRTSKNALNRVFSHRADRFYRVLTLSMLPTLQPVVHYSATVSRRRCFTSRAFGRDRVALARPQRLKTIAGRRKCGGQRARARGRLRALIESDRDEWGDSLLLIEGDGREI